MNRFLDRTQGLYSEGDSTPTLKTPTFTRKNKVRKGLSQNFLCLLCGITICTLLLAISNCCDIRNSAPEKIIFQIKMASSLSQDAFHTPDEWVHSVMWNFKVKTLSHPSAHSSEVSPLETQKWVRSVKDDTRGAGLFFFFFFLII